MRRLGLALCLAGCSSARLGSSDTGAPSLILPAHFAEGETGKDGGGAPGAGASGDPGREPVSADLPDPEPLVTRDQWDFLLEYDRGTMRVKAVHPVRQPRPVATARRVGRFAFELWIGKELVDRVRFDFPLLAADEPRRTARRPLHDAPEFGPGARTSARVLVPASDRATSARLVDRATGRATSLPWPPISTEKPEPVSN